MAQLDSRILFGYSPTPIEPYGNALARAEELQGMRQRNMLAQVQMQRAQEEMAQQQQQRNALAAYVRGVQAPEMAASQAALSAGGGPTVANAQRMPAVDPRQQMAYQMLKAGLMSPGDHFKVANPDTEVKDYKEVRNPDGSVTIAGLTKDGRTINTRQQPFKAPELRDFGGFVGAFDPVGGGMRNIGAKTQSPDSIASNETTRRGQNMADARSREANDLQRQAQRTQIVETPNGPLLVDKGSGQGRAVVSGGAPVPGDAQMKREAGAKQVLALLDQAERILPDATNSYAGAAVDAVGRAVGHGTTGAQAVGQLKAIEGALMAQMPRMEGPQSNYDVQMYKQAAGNLGDATTPREIKQAAISTIREIQSRYAGGQPKALPSVVNTNVGVPNDIADIMRKYAK